jgi:Na+-translocating ferredoxin:NAD+ oxidoreductase RnfE subunit
MISGISDAARYEFVNNNQPGIARSYWDSFGIGLMMSIVVIILGSLWSLFTGLRARRAEAKQG